VEIKGNYSDYFIFITCTTVNPYFLPQLLHDKHGMRKELSIDLGDIKDPKKRSYFSA
jgi:hypothetical protein